MHHLPNNMHSTKCSEVSIRLALISGFISMKRLGVFLLPSGWDASTSQGYPQHFAGTHLYTWVERATVRVKRLAQEHNTMSPARTRTLTTRSGVKRTNQSVMCHILDTLSFFLVDGLANSYKKSTNEKDLIICLTSWVVLQALCVEAHRPHFL